MNMAPTAMPSRPEAAKTIMPATNSDGRYPVADGIEPELGHLRERSPLHLTTVSRRSATSPRSAASVRASST